VWDQQCATDESARLRLLLSWRIFASRSVLHVPAPTCVGERRHMLHASCTPEAR
jgi:hypothetical protein